MILMIKKLIIMVSIAYLAGCASQTAKMAHKIDNDNKNNFQDRRTNVCKNMLNKRDNEDFIFNSRMIATPIIGVLGLLAAPAILAANVSFDVKDRLTASDLSEKCGGEPIKKTKIVGDVTVNGTLGLLLQGSNIAIYPGGEEVPISTAAEASAN